MEPLYKIVCAQPQDIRWLPAIELAAAALLKGHAPESVLTETTSEPEFQEAQAQGWLWVVIAGKTPVGFAQVDMLGPREVHLKEIDVHPDHGRRGLGTQLVVKVCEWATRCGYAKVTLTTYRDVPWNMPFYAALGFKVVPTHELSAELVAIVADETRRGLEPARRVAMTYRLPS